MRRKRFSGSRLWRYGNTNTVITIDRPALEAITIPIASTYYQLNAT
jgi:hypothetical protein